MTLVVSADERADHGAVVHVLDLARVEGITSFAVNVERKSYEATGGGCCSRAAIPSSSALFHGALLAGRCAASTGQGAAYRRRTSSRPRGPAEPLPSHLEAARARTPSRRRPSQAAEAATEPAPEVPPSPATTCPEGREGRAQARARARDPGPA